MEEVDDEDGGYSLNYVHDGLSVCVCVTSAVVVVPGVLRCEVNPLQSNTQWRLKTVSD